MTLSWRSSLFVKKTARQLLFEGFTDPLLTVGSMFNQVLAWLVTYNGKILMFTPPPEAFILSSICKNLCSQLLKFLLHGLPLPPPPYTHECLTRLPSPCCRVLIYRWTGSAGSTGGTAPPGLTGWSGLS